MWMPDFFLKLLGSGEDTCTSTSHSISGAQNRAVTSKWEARSPLRLHMIWPGVGEIFEGEHETKSPGDTACCSLALSQTVPIGDVLHLMGHRSRHLKALVGAAKSSQFAHSLCLLVKSLFAN